VNAEQASKKQLQEPTLLLQGEGRWQWRQTSEQAPLNLPG